MSYMIDRNVFSSSYEPRGIWGSAYPPGGLAQSQSTYYSAATAQALSMHSSLNSLHGLQNYYRPSVIELARRDQYRLGIPHVWEDVT